MTTLANVGYRVPDILFSFHPTWIDSPQQKLYHERIQVERRIIWVNTYIGATVVSELYRQTNPHIPKKCTMYKSFAAALVCERKQVTSTHKPHRNGTTSSAVAGLASLFACVQFFTTGFAFDQTTFSRSFLSCTWNVVLRKVCLEPNIKIFLGSKIFKSLSRRGD